MRHFVIQCLMVCAGFLSGASLAQLPPSKSQGDTTFITGGIGSDESIAMFAAAKKWSLLIEMSEIDGSGRGVWIAGINIRVLNAKQQSILETVCDGPLMLLNAPPGQYTVEASYQGKLLKRSVVIKEGDPQKLSLFWRL
ncbi:MULTISPECIES: carboxypeptidase regulatory-like domain-containing protein [unclassified Polynucleobacter]|uniref:carboxypeptidase regulatory-like domain-containing protein n=1 Tax=unclassified Polynucleobacter TaxID=2640945 RepID=UPI002573C6B8|nr:MULTISPECIES: carboxypeptidase regulatory-like domain-containing protein [unclassified Polynucleobacter]BEI43379.1 carboxypeptidase-like regulatory domain-containing protein [Polynucleobacter sp. HIN10]BEI45155.1 carboxypeptidase-like regulatory domain-containing protein [Polynucleobacter sp. HIN11]